jgi:hypothetical protein
MDKQGPIQSDMVVRAAGLDALISESQTPSQMNVTPGMETDYWHCWCLVELRYLLLDRLGLSRECLRASDSEEAVAETPKSNCTRYV